MEPLLNQLQEQNELARMENFSLNFPKSALPPPRKYVSIFRINGTPILPPLMTTEKRIQMRKLKEMAVKVEQRLKENKRQESFASNQSNDIIKCRNIRTDFRQTADNISQRSQEYYEAAHREAEESMVLLKNILQRQQGGTDEKFVVPANINSNPSINFFKNGSKEKLQKLQKSEILIYDNSANEVIQLPAENEKNTAEDWRTHLTEVERQENLDYILNRKASHLLLAGANTRGVAVTPSICLNPPTPLTIKKIPSVALSSGESAEFMITKDALNKSLDLEQGFSSDESDNSLLTYPNHKSKRYSRQSSPKPAAKPQKSDNKVCKKIQQFEAISNDTANSPQTSPRKFFNISKASCGTPTGTMNRSATSPSLKLSASTRSSSSRSQSLAQDSDNSPENALIRSSSFTLEVPSKALIEHMQQQNNEKAVIKSPLTTLRKLFRKPLSSSLRAYKDTIESKAKKVQKVEVKSTKQKLQKNSIDYKSSPTSGAAQSSFSSNASTQFANQISKTKKSPYDTTKTSHTLQKTTSTQMRKSSPLSSNVAQSKASNSRLTSNLSILNSARTTLSGKESVKQMDSEQKNKFMQLLAQQAEEQKRLQKSFEIQQQMLIGELLREINISPVKSPSNSNLSLSKNSSSMHKITEQQKMLSSRQQRLNSNISLQKPTAASVDLKQFKTQSNHHLVSPSLISNNSSHIFVEKIQLQPSSHKSPYIQPSHSFLLNNTHSSSNDNSNFNTSFDTSTQSIPTSPNTACATPTFHNNVMDKKTTPSSRRRLFITEINVGIDGNVVTSPSMVNSSCSSAQSIGEQVKNLSNINKSSQSLTSEINKRPSTDNSLLLHAAATKINACARGFLVRRLFQTEQIQRVVQTIRDTLIFVLNLHIETIENPEESETPANIRLKARLLQQLSSACNTLHSVFFKISIKERMEIIARDRKRIKTKLMSLKNKR